MIGYSNCAYCSGSGYVDRPNDCINRPSFSEWYNSLDVSDRPQFTDYEGKRIVYCDDIPNFTDYRVVGKVCGVFHLEQY